MMRMLRELAAKSWGQRIPSVFVFFLVLAVQFGNVEEASARSKKISVAPFDLLASARQAGMLNYPSLPPELMDRIHGLKAKAPAEAKVDSAIGQQWGLVNIGFFDAFTPLVQPVKASTQSCSSEVVVAVVDTGIDYTHPDLKNNIWVNRGETGPWAVPQEWVAKGITCRDKSCNGIDDDGNGFVDDVVGWDFVHDLPLPYDTHGHGTHIAGIIAAEAANGIGITGVCPKVSIMPLKYYDNSGGGYNNLQNTVRAIQYAVKNGAQIINYSGGGADPAMTERMAIEEAQRKGILFVAAAGNDGHNNEQEHYFPASYPLDNIIGVASVNRENRLLPSSNFGRTVHLAAPGLSIMSALPEGRFGTMSGTSQATAFVTGAAALLLSQVHGRVDYHKLKLWLTEGAKPMKGNEHKQLLSAGLLNIPRALQVQHDDLRGEPANGAPAIALSPSKGTALARPQ